MELHPVPRLFPTNQVTRSSSYTDVADANMTNDDSHYDTYDAEGNILTVDGGGNGAYVDDAMNRRIRVQTSSATTDYLYDYAGRRISSWLNPSAGNPGTGTEGRIYWGGQQIAYRAADGTTYFDQQDYLGTERLRTNSTGAVASSYSSLPWGDASSATIGGNGANQDNALFAGLDTDANTAGAPISDHAQFRNYSFYQGRWLAPDPYDGSYDATNPQSFNRYAYVLNNPISFIDPTGQDCYTLYGDTWSVGETESTDDNLTNSPIGGVSGTDPGTTVCTDAGSSWPCQEYGSIACGNGNGGGGSVTPAPPAIYATLSAPSNLPGTKTPGQTCRDNAWNTYQSSMQGIGQRSPFRDIFGGAAGGFVIAAGKSLVTNPAGNELLEGAPATTEGLIGALEGANAGMAAFLAFNQFDMQKAQSQLTAASAACPD
jgi:RHS repeat-associated protein